MGLKMGSSDLPGSVNLSEKEHDVIDISDLEEGEIHEASDLDDISDVSTEEELLLRERIKFLENYNSALGKKEARLRSKKDAKLDVNKIRKPKLKPPVRVSSPLTNLVVIDDVDDEVPYAVFKGIRSKVTRNTPKRRKRTRSRKSLSHKPVKEKSKIALKNVPSSSSDSDCENTKQHKRILREAVGIPKLKVDNSTLKSRLFNFIQMRNTNNTDTKIQEVDKIESSEEININIGLNTFHHQDQHVTRIVECVSNNLVVNATNDKQNVKVKGDLIDKELNAVYFHLPDKQANDKSAANGCTSEDDAETLRQLALNSKCLRKISDPRLLDCKSLKSPETKHEKEMKSQEEVKLDDSTDSETAELRMIALKSAILKKALDRKRLLKNKDKRNFKRKKKSLSRIFSEDELENLSSTHLSNDNNTEVEMVDMEIEVERCKSPSTQTSIFVRPENSLGLPGDVGEQNLFNEYQYYDSNNYILKPMKHEQFPLDTTKKIESIEEEEEDEDILRVRLLNSISKSISKNVSQKSSKTPVPTIPAIMEPDQVKCGELSDSGLIIKLGESDSGSDCETTKNLTKMHRKLMQQSEFQKNLDLYLKTARSQFESKSPVVKKDNAVVKKDTPQAVKHLPEADQREYRQLVKRMSELSARKQAIKNSLDLSQNTLKVAMSSANIQLPVVTNITRTVQSAINKNNTSATERTLERGNGPSVLDMQLDLTKRKIINQEKVAKQLQDESVRLKLNKEALFIQLEAIKVAWRKSCTAYNNNQKILSATQVKLTWLRKKQQILQKRINISPQTKVNNNISITIKQNVTPLDVTPSNDKLLENIAIKSNTVNTVSKNTQMVNKIVTKPSTAAALLTLKKTELENPSKSQLMKNKFHELGKLTVNKNETPAMMNRKTTKLSNDPFFSNTDHSLPKRSKGNSENIDISNLEDRTPDIMTVEKVTSPETECVSTPLERNFQIEKELCTDDNISNKKICNNYLERSVTPYNCTESILIVQNLEIPESNRGATRIDTIPDGTNVIDMVENSQINSPSNSVIDLERVKHKDSVSCVETKDNLKTESITLGSCEIVVIPFTPSVVDAGSAESSLFNAQSDSGDTLLEHSNKERCAEANLDYISPLQVLKDNWSEDAQAIFCPYEVGGSCKDPECKYFHPRP